MSNNSKGYLYILRSTKSEKLYFGSTIDPQNRLARHNSGRVAATRSKGPWLFECIVEFSSIKLARRAEQWLKRMHKKELLEMIIDHKFNWPQEFEPIQYVSIG